MKLFSAGSPPRTPLGVLRLLVGWDGDTLVLPRRFRVSISAPWCHPQPKSWRRHCTLLSLLPWH